MSNAPTLRTNNPDFSLNWFILDRSDGDISFFAQNTDLAAKWVNYLVNNGLHPANQLCTDDFAGHPANNINLAIKATVGIACYAELLRAVGSKGDAEKYRKIAEEFAAEIETFGNKFDHTSPRVSCAFGAGRLFYVVAEKQ